MDDLLVLLVLAAAVNPLRHVGAVDVESVQRRSALVLAASAAAGTVVVATILAAETILTALDLSTPTTLVAVGLVALVTGLHDIVRDPVPVVVTGSGSAIGAVAVVVLLRPAVVIGALGAGAAGSVLWSVATGLAALTAGAATAVLFESSPVTRALGRLVGGFLVVLAVGLGVNAAFRV